MIEVVSGASGKFGGTYSTKVPPVFEGSLARKGCPCSFFDLCSFRVGGVAPSGH